MNKIQELKDRIYKYNPELKELSFGCEVTFFDGFQPTSGLKRFTNAFFLCNALDKDIVKIFVKSPAQFLMIKKEHLNKVLGHPIHLEHILKAMGDRNDLCLRGRYLLIPNSSTGDIGYNLKESFDQNITDNPELLNFLLEVIK